MMLRSVVMPEACYRVTGFGLTGLTVNDDRFDKNGYIYNSHGYCPEAVVDILRDIDGICLEYDYPQLCDIVHFDGNTICFVIPSSCWANVEMVDDAESVHIPHGGFANYSKVMDARDGHCVSSPGHLIFRKQYQEYLSARYECQRFSLEFELTEQAYQLGYRSFDEAVRYTVPYVPDSIRSLCKYLQIFQKSTTILDLRPMHFVYHRNANQAPFSIL